MCDAAGSDGHPRSVVSLTLLLMKAKHSLQSALSFPPHHSTESAYVSTSTCEAQSRGESPAEPAQASCVPDQACPPVGEISKPMPWDNTQPSEMNKEGVTYAELQLHHPKRQNKRRPTNKSREFTLQIIVIILGIICFFLLLLIIILGYMFFQFSSEQKIRNMKDISKNASSAEVEVHSNPSVSPPCPGKDSNPCQEKWSCCGKDCYYFSREEKTWDRSVKSCKDLGSSLIKIDSKEKQNFIQSKINYNFWVGLHRKGAAPKWLWLDNSTISRKLNFLQTMSDGKCGHIKPEAIVTAACSREFKFICEKQFSCLGN
ncbi:C-type lectin domain family 7 member A-like [Saccopteryx bilineata]|uniref:C-type lectin domain family 7 member A-like n=1 Tax=Saccopteryx bilineata TaxID=59482 RepID=UPI00338D8B49